jgi:hypothetical protein
LEVRFSFPIHIVGTFITHREIEEAKRCSDFGWTGWVPAPLSFCNNVMPRLQAANITIPREIQNDCDPGDRSDIGNATAFQGIFSEYVRSSRYGIDTFYRGHC